jgi:hypothetical protein
VKRLIKVKKSKQRQDKEAHLLSIEKFVSDIIKSSRRIPSQVEIARGVGLSAKTVNELIKEISLSAIAKSHVSKVNTGNFIASLMLQGQQGNTQAAKLWLQLCYDWSEKMDVGLTVNLAELFQKDD